MGKCPQLRYQKGNLGLAAQWNALIIVTDGLVFRVASFNNGNFICTFEMNIIKKDLFEEKLKL